MSDPKPISPLLDGFALGSPISSHDGVSCCPAIKENSDKKYIVKIITIPATQAQIDALLLAGAYKDPSGAMEYYRIIGEEVMKEAELLTTLSKLDGFLPYEGWQMEPITKRRLGYQVYLVGSYKRSLEKYVRRNPVTHLEAVNLGLDMCSALAVCRQAGSLYVDLKPNNIFMSEKKEYRIGDLGFISMDALSYTTLPDKYRSQYTPPELFDPMAPLNLTVDTYAVGMILYQLYNDGQLPFQIHAPEEPLPTPMNADYELAEIIMKAIHPDPEQRWRDPQEMGRALVDYMQRNAVNDVSITPHTPLEPTAEPMIPPQPEPAAAVAEPVPAEESTDPDSPETPETAAPTPAEETIPVPEDETLPSEEDADDLLPHEMSDELSRMIAHADELLTHEIPEDLLASDEPPAEDPFGFVAVNPEDVDDSDVPVDPLMEEDIPEEAPKKPAKSFVSTVGKEKLKKTLTLAASLLIAAVIAVILFWCYDNFYLQRIDSLVISGDRSQLTVSVETAIDEASLSVVCTDSYGNTKTQKLVNGQATFDDLLPNTMYKIQLEIDGFHGLVGETSNVYTTDATTRIIDFSVVTGSEDGTALLNFTSTGDEPDMWTLIYSADGEEEQRKNFDGHSVTVNGLTVGKMYTFTLEAGNGLSVSGETSVTYMASRLVLAQNLVVDSTDGTDITVSWNSPGDIVVDSWTVRCYNSNTYDEQLTVGSTEAYFSGIDPAISYTIEVTALGMTQPARISITSDPIIVSNFQVDESKSQVLSLSWEHSGEMPDGGWLLMYSIDGMESNQRVVKCEEPYAEITPVIPEAAYRFTIQAADSTTVFGSVHSHTTPTAPDFSANGISAEQITGYLVKTPGEDDWLFDDVGTDSFTDTFAPGEAISAVLHGSVDFYMPGTSTDVLFVIRDSIGNVVSDLIGEDQDTWRNLWYPGDDQYAELDIPNSPSYVGDYSVTIFFNGAKVVTIPFTIS